MPTTNPKIQAVNESITSEVVSTVSPGLHPDAVLPLAEPLMAYEGAAPAYSAGRAAQKALYDALHDMDAAEVATRQKFGGQLVVDGKSIVREIPEDRRAQLAADLGARFESTARAFDRHLGVVNETVEKMTSQVERALQNSKKDSASVAQAASDIRNFVRAMDESKRMDFLYGAIKSGDHEVVTAVLSTTPWVSGLNREQVAFIKEAASERFAAKEWAALGAAKKLADQLTASARNFAQAYRKLAPVVKPSAHAGTVARLKKGAA